jgi:hypothetical protein
LVRDGEGGVRHGPGGRNERCRGQPDMLDEPRFHWGSAYDIDAADGMYTATRRDGRGGSLADPSPGGLLRQIRADYAALPVSRSRS